MTTCSRVTTDAFGSSAEFWLTIGGDPERALWLASENQAQFSPFTCQRNLLEACEELNVTVEAYSPLGTGRHVSDGVCGTSPSAWVARRPRYFCGGTRSGIFPSSRSRRTATESRRMLRSSTSRCPMRTWPRSTLSTKRAAREEDAAEEFDAARLAQVTEVAATS